MECGFLRGALKLDFWCKTLLVLHAMQQFPLGKSRQNLQADGAKLGELLSFPSNFGAVGRLVSGKFFGKNQDRFCSFVGAKLAYGAKFLRAQNHGKEDSFRLSAWRAIPAGSDQSTSPSSWVRGPNWNAKEQCYSSRLLACANAVALIIRELRL
jgi:hypothetical protein